MCPGRKISWASSKSSIDEMKAEIQDTSENMNDIQNHSFGPNFGKGTVPERIKRLWTKEEDEKLLDLLEFLVQLEFFY